MAKLNPVTSYKRNILKTWRRVSHEDIREGMNWYPEAQAIAASIAQGDVVKGAGVLAAFSPQIKWSLNIDMARQALASGSYQGHFPANNLKAARIGHGEDPAKVLGGHKVLAFYHNIRTAGLWPVPVIDRHAIAIALNRIPSDKERRPTPRTYQDYAKAYQQVAAKLSIPVSVLQASTRIKWRRDKGMED